MIIECTKDYRILDKKDISPVVFRVYWTRKSSGVVAMINRRSHSVCEVGQLDLRTWKYEHGNSSAKQFLGSSSLLFYVSSTLETFWVLINSKHIRVIIVYCNAHRYRAICPASILLAPESQDQILVTL